MDVIAEARVAYARGQLVPFLGSGVSRPVCRTWAGMVGELERLAGRPVSPTSSISDLQLADRAALAIERSRFDKGLPAAGIVRAALLQDRPAPPTRSTAAIAELHWPLVLTTNYDDLYPAAVHQRELRTHHLTRQRTSDLERRTSPVLLVGRGAVDCHRVLSALTMPAPPMLWALQGFLGGQATIEVPETDAPVVYDGWAVLHGATSLNSRAAGPSLADQIVVGHADYRRVALQSEGFRRTFGDVFRRRSLLFLGSGLADRYLLDLFSQIIEWYGPGSYPHFAVARRNTIADAQFLQRNYGIWVHETDSHDELPEVVRSLGGHPSTRRYVYRSQSADLVVDTSPLPVTRDSSKCVVLSGGGSKGQPRLEEWAMRYLNESGCLGRGTGSGDNLLVKDAGRQYLWRLRNPPNAGPLILVARARLDPLTAPGRWVNPVSSATARSREMPGMDNKGRLWRDFRVTASALREVFAVAVAEGRRTVVSPLLAAGRLRTVPTPVTLLAMMEAWSSTPPTQRPSLTLHVVDEAVRIDLESHRVDPGRLIPPSGDAVRPIMFWLEVVSGGAGEATRRLVIEDRRRPVHKFLGDYSITGDRWELTLEPVPCLGWAGWRIPEITAWTDDRGESLSLERIGVLHGSTLRLSEYPIP